jgi:AcrR family transcriptional regulator
VGATFNLEVYIVSTGKEAPTRERILGVALKLIGKRGGADVSMSEIAAAAQLSRQAVYLHFRDRSDLLMALVRFVDVKSGISNEVTRIAAAPTGTAALKAMVALQARTNPAIWPVARAIDAVRHRDRAANRSWQDRLQDRLAVCQGIVDRLKKNGELRRGLDAGTATDLLWTLTSLRMWEDLVLHRRWTPQQYEADVTELLLSLLTDGRANR